VAERSGDTAFRTASYVQKRRGASLPAAVQKIVCGAATLGFLSALQAFISCKFVKFVPKSFRLQN
jgi:hypothetical protein